MRASSQRRQCSVAVLRRRSDRVFRKRSPSKFAAQSPATQCAPKNPQTCFEGPFGEVIRATGPSANANPFRFSTKSQDDETDQFYYGYRYYNATLGKWISRDRIGEQGGNNLYDLLNNDSIARIDYLGLLETRFLKNSRNGIAIFFSGPWSQPIGFGEGVWNETDTSLSSWIHLWSGPAGDGICNSMEGTIPLPGPQAPGEPMLTSRHAGAFAFQARDRCGGKFRLYFESQLVAKSDGPNGNAMASEWFWGNKTFSVSAVGDDTKQLYFGKTVDVSLDNQWQTIVYYYPTISFTATPETPLRESNGRGFGYLNFLGFKRL